MSKHTRLGYSVRRLTLLDLDQPIAQNYISLEYDLTTWQSFHEDQGFSFQISSVRHKQAEADEFAVARAKVVLCALLCGQRNPPLCLSEWAALGSSTGGASEPRLA